MEYVHPELTKIGAVPDEVMALATNGNGHTETGARFRITTVTIPVDLSLWIESAIPRGGRSAFITGLLRQERARRENAAVGDAIPIADDGA